MEKKTPKINSLNGLKIFGYLCVFTSHAHLMLRNKFSVMLFFMISGFLLFYRHQDFDQPLTFRTVAEFAFNHIKRFWPVHILLFLVSIALRWSEISGMNLSDFLRNSAMHICLLQSLSANPFRFNYASWYLSALFILYWTALPAIGMMRTAKNPFALLMLLILVCGVLDYYTLKYEPTLDFTYWHPICRIPDFLIGMTVCRIFKEYPLSVDHAIHDLLNFAVVSLFFTMLMIQFYLKESNHYFALLFSLVLYILAHDRGWLCQLLTMPLIQSLEKIGLEFYLCHELIIFVIENKLSASKIQVWVLSLIASLIVAYGLHWIRSLNIRKKLSKGEPT